MIIEVLSLADLAQMIPPVLSDSKNKFYCADLMTPVLPGI